MENVEEAVVMTGAGETEVLTKNPNSPDAVVFVCLADPASLLGCGVR
jgi:hypothetical protein